MKDWSLRPRLCDTAEIDSENVQNRENIGHIEIEDV